MSISGSFRFVLDTSLPQNRPVRAGADVVTEFTGYHCGSAIAASKNSVIPGRADVTPTGCLQSPDHFADLKRPALHPNMPQPPS
jgi:hypothetical protein